jgi:hypothetical protein
MAEEIVTSMEMTELGQLLPSRPSPAPIELEEVGPSAAEVLRSIYVRVWEPFESGGRMEWSAGDWETELVRPGVKAWLARVGGEIVGLVELELEPTGDVGIVVFGLPAGVHRQGIRRRFPNRHGATGMEHVVRTTRPKGVASDVIG